MHTEDSFTTKDGLRLHAQDWLPEGVVRARLILLHGFGDHSGRYAEFAAFLNAAGVAVHTYDQRGHGKSPGKRAYINHFDDFLEDLDLYRAHVRDRIDGAPLFLMGHSMGGMVLTRYAQTRDIPARGLVFSSPFLGFPDDVPQMLLKLANVLSIITPWLPVGGVDNRGLSRDPAAVAAADNDPLTFHGKVAARTGAQFYGTIQKADTAYGKITLPSLVLHGTADRVVPCAGAKKLHAGLGAADKTLQLFEGGYHELWNDLDKGEFMGAVLDWMEARLAGGV